MTAFRPKKGPQPGNAVERGIALLFGLFSGIASFALMEVEPIWLDPIKAALRSAGLDRDITDIVVAPGLAFGAIAGIFAVWGLRWKTFWLGLMPIWSTVTMWLATYVAALTFSDATGIGLSFLSGSAVGCSLMALAVLVGQRRVHWPAIGRFGWLAPTVSAAAIGYAIPANDGRVFLLLFIVWQSLVLLSWANANDPAVDRRQNL